MATAVGLPVIGLYAATRVARCGPYLSRSSCVDRYTEAARQFLGKEPSELPWSKKIELPGVKLSEAAIEHLKKVRYLTVYIWMAKPGFVDNVTVTKVADPTMKF